GQNPYHIRVIDRSGEARFFLQLSVVIDAVAEIAPQQFHRHQIIPHRVARLVNRSHAAEPERLDQNELTEFAFRAYLPPAFRTSNLRQWKRVGSIDRRPAGGTLLLGRRDTLGPGHGLDCSILPLPRKE